MGLYDDNQNDGFSFREEPGFNGSTSNTEATETTTSFTEVTEPSTSFTEVTSSANTTNDDAVFTPASTYYEDSYQTQSSSSASEYNNMTFKEFYKECCSPATKKGINGACILLYVCCGLTFALALAALGVGLEISAGILDAFLLLGLTLGVHIGKSRVCSIIILIYSLINCLFTLLTTGRPGGWFIIVGGVYATIHTFSARKQYKEFIGQ